MRELNTLKQYQAIRTKLEREREALRSRLSELDTVLNGSSVPVVRNGASHGRDMSLKDAIAQVTAHKALSKKEIYEAVKGIGYRFTTAKPLSSINSLLYSKTGKAAFTRQDGKFAPKG